MKFERANFRLNDKVTLGKRNIKVINDTIVSVSLMDDYNVEIMVDLMKKDGVEIEEFITHMEDSKIPFKTAEVLHKGKNIGTIYINYRQEVRTKFDTKELELVE